MDLYHPLIKELINLPEDKWDNAMYIIGRWIEDELYHLFGYSDGVYDIVEYCWIYLLEHNSINEWTNFHIDDEGNPPYLETPEEVTSFLLLSGKLKKSHNI